ncbi:hypothetical protein [Sphingopyxis sp. GC21]|nr:hypothetical protein [Sphingopyxis sp. GC21]
MDFWERVASSSSATIVGAVVGVVILAIAGNALGITILGLG